MSRIAVTVGSASVSIEASYDRRQADAAGAVPSYYARELCDATCAALLAINTPDAVRWAHALYEATALNLGPRRGQPTPEGA